MNKKILIWTLLFVLLSSSVNSLELIDGVIAYWDFDTDEDPVQDQNDSYDLALSGATFDSGDGILGSSFLYDTVTDSLINNTLLDSIPTGRLSVSFWFKHVDTFDSGKTLDESLFSKSNIGNDDRIWIYLTSNDGKLDFYTSAASAGVTISATTSSWTAGRWYHIVVTWGSTNGMVLYVNGTEEAASTPAPMMSSGTGSDFFVGLWHGGSNFGLNDGNIDEMGVWDRELNVTEVSELYNSHLGFAYPFTFIPPSTPIIGTNILTPENGTVSNNQTQIFTYNYTANSDNADNCSLLGNFSGTFGINQTDNSPTNNTNNTFTTFLDEGEYIWNVECIVNSTLSNRSVNNFTLIIDLTNPLTSSSFSNNDGYTVHPNNLTGWFYASDPNLYSLKINDSITGTIVLLTSLNVTEYNYSLNLDISAYPIGKNNITVTWADGHTNNTISDWDYSKNLLSKEITFDFSTKWYETKYLKIKPKNPGMFDSFDVEKKTDRYIYKYKTSKGKQELSFIVSSTDDISIINRPNSKYKGWLVNPNLQKWTDFNLKNPTGNEIYKVVRTNKKEVEVTISNLDGREEYIFESSGDLNIVTQTYVWYLLNVTQTYETDFIEGIPSFFTLNITTNSSIISTNATFIYNGTEYTPTKTNTSDFDYYNISINQPIIFPRQSNITYNWSYNIISDFGTNTYTTNRSDTIYKIIIENCGNNITLNYTVVDETTSAAITDYDFEALYHLWDNRNLTHIRNYSFSNETLSTNNQLCIYPDFANYTTNYETSFTSTNYDQTQLIIAGGYLNATQQAITIYLTNSTLTTSIIVTLIDEDDNLLIEYIIEAWQYNLGDDDYILIDTEKTDLDGQALFNLDVVEKEYRFIVKNPSGTVVLTTTKQKLIKTDYTLTVILGTGTEAIEKKIYQLDTTLTANREDKTFNVTWNEVSSVISSIIFIVEQTNITDNVELYNINSPNTTGVFNYLITSNESATYVGNLYGISVDDGNKYFIRGETIDLREAYDIFGDESLVAAFLLVGTLIFIGAAIGPEVSIMFAIISLIVSAGMGLMNVSLASIVGLIVGLLILLVKIKRGIN